MRFRWNSRNSWLLCCCVFLIVNVWYRFVFGRQMSTLTWDVLGMYLYLPAFAYDDPATLEKTDSLFTSYRMPGSFYQAFKAPNGNYIMKYSAGQAIMFLPAFMAGHLAAPVLGYPQDGFSVPYQLAVNFESLIIACLGLWLLRRLLLTTFNDRSVAHTLIVIGLASNFFHYACLENAFQHTYLFLLYCGILLLSISWNDRPSKQTAVALGLLCGMAALIRPTEMLTAFIPLLWNVYDRRSLRAKFNLLTSLPSHVFLFIAFAFLVGSIQLVYWKVFSGNWIYFSYGEDQTFNWLKPHVWDVLASYKKGWLLYTPVMFLALFGFVPLFLKRRKLFWPVLLYMLFFFYLVTAWDNWWYGGSFSMRAMIQSYPLLAFAVAAFFEWVSSSAVAARLTQLFVGLCLYLNGVFAYQAFISEQGTLDSEHINSDYYWITVGRPRINLKDKALLDNRERIPSDLARKLHWFYFNDLEDGSFSADSTWAYSGKYSFKLDAPGRYSPSLTIPSNCKSGCWYRIYVRVYATDYEWEHGKQTQLIATLMKDGKPVKKKFIRIHRLIQTNRWEEVWIDIHDDDPSASDTLMVRLWSAGTNKTLYADDFRIGRVEP